MALGSAEPAAVPGAVRTTLGAAVCGLGVALPETVVDNERATASLEVDGPWVERRTGIRTRRWAATGDRLHELAAAAASRALADAGLEPDEIDLLLVATISADELTPACAPLVAAELGAGRIGAIDVGAACTGFISALALGSALIETARAGRVLVVGAEMLSRHIDPTDRNTAILFADGAGAVVLEACEGARVGPVVLASDGALGELIRAPRATGILEMDDGRTVFVEAVRRMSAATHQACAEAGLALDEIDLFVYHQANARILASLTERLGLPPERVVEAIAETGNTSAASIPLALGHARDEGRLTPGSRVLLGAFGAGLTWGAATLTWGRDE